MKRVRGDGSIQTRHINLQSSHLVSFPDPISDSKWIKGVDLL